MYKNSNDLEALQIFRQREEQFPMTARCLEMGTEIRLAADKDGVEETPDLDVIWAGVQDGGKCCVLCQLTAGGGGRINSFFARAIDRDKREIARAQFVSFGTDRAYVRLEIPENIFHECSVQLQAAAVNETGVAAAGQRTVSLENLYIGKLEIQYQILDPVIRRRGKFERIDISYYKYADENAFDYVYPGRGGGSNQMYLDSGGSIRIKDMKLQRASMRLMVSNEENTALYERKWKEHPVKPKIEVSDELIEYRFAREWEGLKLTDCLGNSTSAKVDYLLEIGAETDSGSEIKMLVTNVKDIYTHILADSIKEIPLIRADLDCFGQGTTIRMADGSQKAVEKIQAGELVKTRAGGSASVKEVQVLEERQLLGIQLDSGKTVFLTDGHAVSTVDGVYPVYRLKEGQTVITEDGTGVVRQILPKCERCYTVYSLSMEGDEEWLYAGGMMVHSSDGAELFCDRDWVREDLPGEWLTDYDNALHAGLLYGR